MSLLLLLRSPAEVAAATLTISVSPDPPAVGQSLLVTATLLDADGLPRVGKTIYFTITGANTASGSDVTDANGEATFLYTVTNAGTDAIRAQWGAADGLDLVTTDVSTNRVYRHDGFSITELDFFATLTLPKDVTWDGDNLVTLTDDGTVRLHSGFSSTVTSSFAAGSAASGLAWDGAHLLVSYETGEVKKFDGVSSTLLAAFSTGLELSGVAWDGTNVIVSAQIAGDDTVTRYVGFTSVVDATVTMPYAGGLLALHGCVWFEGNLYTATDVLGGAGDDELRKHSGFSDTITTTIDSPSSQVSGIGWTVGMETEVSVVAAVRGSGRFGRVSGRVIP